MSLAERGGGRGVEDCGESNRSFFSHRREEGGRGNSRLPKEIYFPFTRKKKARAHQVAVSPLPVEKREVGAGVLGTSLRAQAGRREAKPHRDVGPCLFPSPSGKKERGPCHCLWMLSEEERNSGLAPRRRVQWWTVVASLSLNQVNQTKEGGRGVLFAWERKGKLAGTTPKNFPRILLAVPRGRGGEEGEEEVGDRIPSEYAPGFRYIHFVKSLDYSKKGERGKVNKKAVKLVGIYTGKGGGKIFDLPAPAFSFPRPSACGGERKKKGRRLSGASPHRSIFI